MTPQCPKTATDLHVLLASHSPRRRELMSLLVPAYDVVSLRDVDESYPADTQVDAVAQCLSLLKAESYRSELRKGEVLVTADTVVIIDNCILGKPDGRREAIEMIKRLSGRTHRVMTGVTLTTIDSVDSFSETTLVTFGELTDGEIEAYVDICKPYDKAGAYGIQEWIGAIGIAAIDGDYYNVMGLPVHALYRRLKALR